MGSRGGDRADSGEQGREKRVQRISWEVAARKRPSATKHITGKNQTLEGSIGGLTRRDVHEKLVLGAGKTHMKKKRRHRGQNGQGN